ncbi:hypothetical protein PCASD_14448 [Puccinia coronata f. sp. avenae]|nr:hypothetical protein PCASD_24593 [Puccinia coronata f. sp. avenae]PLW35830.1 hypothetical protein PCASD_14448 [Puccinia coronata f. sp. avenae]
MIVLSESKTGDFGRELWKLGEEEANELSKVPGAGKMARFASDQNGAKADCIFNGVRPQLLPDFSSFVEGFSLDCPGLPAMSATSVVAKKTSRSGAAVHEEREQEDGKQEEASQFGPSGGYIRI